MPKQAVGCMLIDKIFKKCRRAESRYFARRPFRVSGDSPYISFTFDDFPQSAYTVGGGILEKYGLRGTYYISFGIRNSGSKSQDIACDDTIRKLVMEGHEIGCHTFSHSDAWETNPDEFENSIVNNQNALGNILPGVKFRTFAYPVGNATRKTKQIAGRHFACCRGGNQTFNSEITDLNNLNSYFLDKRKNDPIQSIGNTIDRNRDAKGWLIFTTHDIDDVPSDYGCTPSMFERVVQLSLGSGAVISPVIDAFRKLNPN